MPGGTDIVLNNVLLHASQSRSGVSPACFICPMPPSRDACQLCEQSVVHSRAHAHAGCGSMCATTPPIQTRCCCLRATRQSRTRYCLCCEQKGRPCGVCGVTLLGDLSRLRKQGHWHGLHSAHVVTTLHQNVRLKGNKRWMVVSVGLDNTSLGELSTPDALFRRACTAWRIRAASCTHMLARRRRSVAALQTDAFRHHVASHPRAPPSASQVCVNARRGWPRRSAAPCASIVGAR